MKLRHAAALALIGREQPSAGAKRATPKRSMMSS
jgi:hypothetical protein